MDAHRFDGANFDLKEEIRSYWSKRSETFDLAFGHRIPAGPEADAWQAPIRALLGDEPKRVLELACGTGEVTRLIHDLGHDVTALDFSEAMLRVAQEKHAGKPRLRFILADAENTMEPDGHYDAVICRHLVWTLTEPAQAFADWHRVLKPGGRVLFFDGDWAEPKPSGRMARLLISWIDRMIGPDGHYDGALGERHGRIMQALPFGKGLRPEMVMQLLKDAGFTDIAVHPHSAISRAQRKTADFRNKLRTLVYRRFILTCRKG
jgi:ubiquinone/menaquinone biosynthesis C-methylase UbiE